MTEQDDDKSKTWREQSNRFHEDLVEKRGPGWQAFWGTRESQISRYEVFLRHLPLDGAAVLDVGCGFGDFFAHARQRGVSFSRYLGIDLDETILQGARQRQQDADFAVLDILHEDPPFRPDYIVASGIMAVPLPDYPEYVRRVLLRFHGLCTTGFALNFLSTLSQKPDEKSRYVEPWWLLQLFQQEIDWRCVLVHDYRQNDLTLVHRRPG